VQRVETYPVPEGALRIEAWGRGIQRIFDACREAGTTEPRIQVEPGELWFEFLFSPAYLDSISSGTATQETTQEQIMTLLPKSRASLAKVWQTASASLPTA
jgi:ATP-dependent DNA helicase RecG